MIDKLKDAVPGAVISVAITLMTTLFVFSGTYGSLQTTVQAHTEAMKISATKEDVKETEQKALKATDRILQRIDQIDQKIDDIHKILINFGRK